MKFKNIGMFIVFMLLSIFIISPQFFVQSPGIVDDGTDLLYVKNNSFSQIINDQVLVDERSRPLRFVYRKVVYEINNLNMAGHFFANTVVLATICFLLFLILEHTTSNKRLSFLSATLFLFLPSIVASFYRLGTDEPLQLLLVLLALYAWLKKKNYLVLIFLILNLFVKETSILFLFPPLVYFLKERKWKLFSVNLLALVLWGRLLLYKMQLPGAEYISRAGFSWSLFITNIRFAWMYSVLTFSILLILCWKAIKHNKNLDLGIILGGSLLAGSIPLGFWDMRQDYYYLTIVGLLVIGFGHIVSCLPKKINLFLLSAYLLTLSINTIFYVIPIAINLHRKSISDGALSEYLLSGNFKDTHIFSNVIGFEGNHKIYIYTNEWTVKSKSFSPSINLWIDTSAEIEDTNRGILINQTFDSFKINRGMNRLLISEKKFNLGSNFSETAVCGHSPFIGTECKYYIYKPTSQL